MSIYFFMSVTLGNVFTALVNMAIERPDGSSLLEGVWYFGFFTVMIVVATLVFIGAALLYQGRSYMQGEEKAV